MEPDLLAVNRFEILKVEMTVFPDPMQQLLVIWSG
jgi:hypothetical protein